MKIFRLILVLIVVVLLSAAGYWLYGLYGFVWSFPETTYTNEDLVNNYELKQTEIEKLRAFVKRIVPPGKYVDIEFENDSKLDIFHVRTEGLTRRNWNVQISSGTTDALLMGLGWDHETFTSLSSTGCK